MPNAAAPALILYQRDDCHLCDLALEVLAMVRAPEFDSVFIDDDRQLEMRYGERVPVLRDDASGLELDWPFDVGALQRFLSDPRRDERPT
ncbi:MAG: glutaredoxin family protein [Luteimonas sp.]